MKQNLIQWLKSINIYSTEDLYSACNMYFAILIKEKLPTRVEMFNDNVIINRQGIEGFSITLKDLKE